MVFDHSTFCFWQKASLAFRVSDDGGNVANVMATSLLSNGPSVLVPSCSGVVRKPSARCAVVRPMIDVKRELEDTSKVNVRQLIPNLDFASAYVSFSSAFRFTVATLAIE